MFFDSYAIDFGIGLSSRSHCQYYALSTYLLTLDISRTRQRVDCLSFLFFSFSSHRQVHIFSRIRTNTTKYEYIDEHMFFFSVLVALCLVARYIEQLEAHEHELIDRGYVINGYRYLLAFDNKKRSMKLYLPSIVFRFRQHESRSDLIVENENKRR
jgi:hypothetical protein